MKVELLHNTPLWVCSKAIRTCWNSHDKSDNGGEKDKALIDRVGNKLNHSSTLEHLVYSLDIKDISRALLQELARHRMASLSVKSTRFTLKELKKEKNFDVNTTEDCFRAEKYLVMTKNRYVDACSIEALENLRNILTTTSISNDVVKYCLPEAYKTELVWTINARSLQNFLILRTNKAALKEIQELAHEIFKNIPDEHKYLFVEYVNTEG